MTMITPSYLGETIEYSSLHACRSTLEDPTRFSAKSTGPRIPRSKFTPSTRSLRSSIPAARGWFFRPISGAPAMMWAPLLR